MTYLDALQGIPHAEHGTHSPHPFVQAVNVAGFNLPCFQSNGDSWLTESKMAATFDLQILSAWFESNPYADWRVRAGPQDGLHCIKFPSRRRVGWLENDMGPLTASWVIERKAGHAYHIFARGKLDPELAVGRSINASKAELKCSAPLPGSVHRPTGEVWRWRPGHAPGERELAPLPLAWLSQLPKVAPGITATVTTRPEFVPYSAWSDHE